MEENRGRSCHRNNLASVALEEKTSATVGKQTLSTIFDGAPLQLNSSDVG